MHALNKYYTQLNAVCEDSAQKFVKKCKFSLHFVELFILIVRQENFWGPEVDWMEANNQLTLCLSTIMQPKEWHWPLGILSTKQFL